MELVQDMWHQVTKANAKHLRLPLCKSTSFGSHRLISPKRTLQSHRISHENDVTGSTSLDDPLSN